MFSKGLVIVVPQPSLSLTFGFANNKMLLTVKYVNAIITTN